MGTKYLLLQKEELYFGSSAGRVQSPTLRIICEKEKEIDIFKPQEYWDLKIELIDDNKNKISCSLIMDGKKYDKFTLNTKEKAESIKKSIKNNLFTLIVLTRKKKSPILPFLTPFYFRMHHQNWVLAKTY